MHYIDSQANNVKKEAKKFMKKADSDNIYTIKTQVRDDRCIDIVGAFYGDWDSKLDIFSYYDTDDACEEVFMAEATSKKALSEYINRKIDLKAGESLFIISETKGAYKLMYFTESEDDTVCSVSTNILDEYIISVNGFNLLLQGVDSDREEELEGMNGSVFRFDIDPNEVLF